MRVRVCSRVRGSFARYHSSRANISLSRTLIFLRPPARLRTVRGFILFYFLLACTRNPVDRNNVVARFEQYRKCWPLSRAPHSVTAAQKTFLRHSSRRPGDDRGRAQPVRTNEAWARPTNGDRAAPARSCSGYEPRAPAPRYLTVSRPPIRATEQP